MNKLIADINRNANNDIELLNESTRRIRALLKDADEKMQSFNEATERLREMIAETEKISSGNKAAGKNVYIYREPVQIGRGLVLALTARP